MPYNIIFISFSFQVLSVIPYHIYKILIYPESKKLSIIYNTILFNERYGKTYRVNIILDRL